MRKFKKRLIAMVMAVAIAAGGVLAPGAAGDVQAASKPYMKKLNVKFDLKKNKNFTFNVKYYVVGNKKVTGKIKNFKITDAEESGYKKLTFTYVRKDAPWKKPTDKQIHKLAQRARKYRYFAGGTFFTAVDYDTGLSLEEQNNFGVTVKNEGWKWSGKKTYKDSHGCWTSFDTISKVKVTVTYPKDYKGLCIVIGPLPLKQIADGEFQPANVPFGKTVMYKKNKKNIHCMRVNNK